MSGRSSRTVFLITSALLLSALCALAQAKTIYVDDNATGANNGTSWADAYTFLQEALADVRLAEEPAEIRVAQGTYKPNQGLGAAPEFDWKTATFELISGVTLKGGYAGFGKQDPNTRDIDLYQTVLSGDLDSNDPDVNDARRLAGDPNRAENSYHVVDASSVEEAVLDGFIVAHGNADGAEEHDYNRGGGLYSSAGSPVVRNCIFTRNSCLGYGAGIYVGGRGYAVIMDCEIAYPLSIRTVHSSACLIQLMCRKIERFNYTQKPTM